MPRRARLDAELVRRGLARSRGQAGELIDAGRVTVGGAVAHKAATAVATDAAVVVTTSDRHRSFASRGGHKLAGALATFAEFTVEGRSALDAGASTGGFTDVLLQSGACHVTAVDVGYGQLDWSLRSDPRVTVLDRTNVRHLTPDMLSGAPDVVVADLSFISLRVVLPALVAVAAPGADFVVMVKPQFEVGRQRVGKGGVVRAAMVRAEAVLEVAASAHGCGLGTVDVSASPLPGPAGNVEYFLWLATRGGPPDPQRVRAVVADGPQ